MFATTTPKSSSVLWQGETQDGYTLRLSRSGLAKIMSNLKQTGLHTLVQKNLNGSREAAVVRVIAQVVSNATHSSPGQNTQVFTTVGKTRKYQIVTHPIDHQQSAILFVRSRPLELEHEFEGEFEPKYKSGLWNESEAFNPRPSRIPRPTHQAGRPRSTGGSRPNKPSRIPRPMHQAGRPRPTGVSRPNRPSPQQSRSPALRSSPAPRSSSPDAIGLPSLFGLDRWKPSGSPNPTRENFEALRDAHGRISTNRLMKLIPGGTPNSWTIESRTQRGFKYVWQDVNGAWHVHGHEPDTGAQAGHVGGNRWIVRISRNGEWLLPKPLKSNFPVGHNNYQPPTNWSNSRARNVAALSHIP